MGWDQDVQGYGRQVSRRAILKFRLLAKLISGKPALVALSFFGFSSALLPIVNSEEPLNILCSSAVDAVHA